MVDGTTDELSPSTTNWMATEDNDDTSNIWDFALYMMLVVTLPTLVVLTLCCFCRHRKSLTDLTRERLEHDRRVQEAFRGVDQDVLKTRVVAIMVPPHPVATTLPADDDGAAVALATSTGIQKSDCDDDTMSDTTTVMRAEAQMVVLYDRSTRRYKWTDGSKDLIGQKKNHTGCSICLDAFDESCVGGSRQHGDSEGHVLEAGMPNHVHGRDRDRGDNYARALFLSKCDHFFHLDCILGWIHNNGRRPREGRSGRNTNTIDDGGGEECCPYCRQPLWDFVAYQEIQGEVALQLYQQKSPQTV